MYNSDNKNNFTKFITYISALFLFLYIASFFYENDKEKLKIINEIEKSTILDSNEKYTIKVNYPRFKNDNLNDIVTEYVYSYTKKFKTEETTPKSLFIDYELYYIKDYINIVFNINNSLSNVKYSNIILNIKNNKEASISDIYDKDYITDEILSYTYHKYPRIVYNTIKSSNIKNYTYILSDDEITVYFYNLSFSGIKYIPYVTISLSEDESVSEEDSYKEGTKFIVFTFDDGPSEYTLDILKTLELNKSSATFFMLGSKMKNNHDTVLKIYNSNSEIGSHTYSHKYLTKLKESDLNNEINSTSILFNEITGDNIEYLRPPYGSYNKKVIAESPHPLILWNIDPRDWQLRDSRKIYEHIINHACDGCIVLLHDTYKETVEALKETLPALKSLGYEVVSVSKLLKFKDKELSAGEVLKKIN